MTLRWHGICCPSLLELQPDRQNRSATREDHSFFMFFQSFWPRTWSCLFPVLTRRIGSSDSQNLTAAFVVESEQGQVSYGKSSKNPGWLWFHATWNAEALSVSCVSWSWGTGETGLSWKILWENFIGKSSEEMGSHTLHIYGGLVRWGNHRTSMGTWCASRGADYQMVVETVMSWEWVKHA